MTRHLLLIGLLFMAVLTTTAQTKRKTTNLTTNTTQQAKIALLMEQYRFEEAQRLLSTSAHKNIAYQELLQQARLGARMLNATQDVIIIDSIVTDSENFLKAIPLNKESGVITTYNDFFKTDMQPNAYVYQNEMGNKCYYSSEDSTGKIALFTSDNIDNTWTNREPLESLNNNDQLENINYPYMMADGTTLYFAATGKESLGGYDIFVTRYDAENNTYLKPENIGMPFNSPANDYMLAVNELDSIGWFVTDRNQTGGKVCIYIFIPSQSRTTYDASAYTPEQIKALARINNIADTWGDGTLRDAALARLEKIKQEINNPSENPDFKFIINDQITYFSLSDFKHPANVERFQHLQTIKAENNQLAKALDKCRNYYASANKQEKEDLKNEILNNEHQLEKNEIEIKNIEKEIRNTEIAIINN